MTKQSYRSSTLDIAKRRIHGRDPNYKNQIQSRNDIDMPNMFAPLPPIDHDNEVLEQAIKGKDIQTTGRVVGVIRRKWRQYCGMLQENPSGSNATKHIFVPAEKKIPKIRIETRQAAKLKGQRIIVAADAWPR